MSDEDYREFQQYIAENPGFGDSTRGADGTRRIRWKAKGRGTGDRVSF
jgi:hypothetical protein